MAEGSSQGSLIHRYWRSAAWLGASGLASACLALAWVPFRVEHSNVVIALAMILATTAAGASRRRTAVVGAAVSAAVTFTYFDTIPFDRFTISKQPDVATAASLVVVGLLTGEVALRMARARRSAASASSLLDRVRGAAELLAQGEELGVFIETVAAELRELLGASTCVFSAEPLPGWVAVVHRSGALSAHGATTDGSATHTGPALPVWALGDVVGHFLLPPGSGTSTPDRLRVAITL
ncbi:MAG: DUF4118 domain-containing protein, partial [Solirubrobacteraceae bacterium]